MAVKTNRERLFVVLFVLLFAAVVLPTVFRGLRSAEGPSVEIVTPDERVRTVSLTEIKQMPQLSRYGSVQNQYGNWRNEGTYTGVRLTDLLGDEAGYATIEFVASDGYRVRMEREWIEDPEYPVVLAYTFEGSDVPAWGDGFRVVVLPEDGDVSNAEYGVDSAGSYWVRNVVRIVLD